MLHSWFLLDQLLEVEVKSNIPDPVCSERERTKNEIKEIEKIGRGNVASGIPCHIEDCVRGGVCVRKGEREREDKGERRRDEDEGR